SFIGRMQNEKPQTGYYLKRMKEDIDKPLSAILTLNTFAHTIGAMGVGIQAGKLYGSEQINLFFFSANYESLIAGGMTLSILVISEIIPQIIGAVFWQQLPHFTVSSLRVLLVVLAPFVWMSKGITRIVKTEKGQRVFSRADFAAMADV